MESEGLAKEAETLYPIIQWGLERYSGDLLKDYDFVGVFILSYLALRRPGNWLGAKLKPHKEGSVDYDSELIVDIPLLLDLLNPAYLRKKFGSFEKLRVIDIFDRMLFLGIRNKDNYINNCLVNWAQRKRPCVLLFRIPSPLEVLRMQSRGTRVVTLFTSQVELSSLHISPLYYMEGMHNHAKDPLEFLIHDLKHMENFIDPSCHLEQVGFFKAMSCLCNGNPKAFFVTVCSFDKLLWRELEYVISDMNCFVPHLMLYMLAKMRLASERIAASQTVGDDSASVLDTTRGVLVAKWKLLLKNLGITDTRDEEICHSETDSMYDVCIRMIDRMYGNTEPMSPEEGEIMREYFNQIARVSVDVVS